jgi:guanidinopropionase
MLHGLRGLQIICEDVVEVSPPFDPAGITALAGVQMMFEILGLAAATFIQRSGR